jgi:predicted metal-dependent phosphoesterase TrpH
MPNHIDLHIHTLFSDGLASPSEILAIVKDKKLAAFSICDHDTLEGYLETRKLLKEGDPELVPGVELSAGKDLDDIHILGYYIDANCLILTDALEDFRRRRNLRGEKMLMRLKDMGIEISFDLVRQIAGCSAIGRPHVADAMVKVGAIRNYESAFISYIGHDGPAYVPKDNPFPKEAIDLIHEAGGLAFLAHAAIGNTASHINEFIDLGLDGIEIYHPKHNSGRRKGFSKLAREKSLLSSGGSDYHGREGRYSSIGSQPVPEEFLTAIKEKISISHRGEN